MALNAKTMTNKELFYGHKACPGCGAALYPHGGHAVVAFKLHGAVRPAGLADGRERHHLALVVAEVPSVEIFGLHAERRIGLHIHLFDAAAVHEVIDVLPAPRRRKIRVDGVEGQAERPGLFLIDVNFQLRAVVLPESSDVPQQGAAPRQLHQLIPRRDEGFMPKPRLILQLEVKAGGVAERADRRGRGDEYTGIDD